MSWGWSFNLFSEIFNTMAAGYLYFGDGYCQFQIIYVYYLPNAFNRKIYFMLDWISSIPSMQYIIYVYIIYIYCIYNIYQVGYIYIHNKCKFIFDLYLVILITWIAYCKYTVTTDRSRCKLTSVFGIWSNMYYVFVI